MHTRRPLPPIMSPMRVGTLDTRRRRRPGIPRGRGRVVFAAVTVLALLYVIGLASGDDERVANAVRDAVETTGTVAPTATIASPTEVNASITATLLPAALSRSAVTVDGSTIALFGGRNTKGASLTQVLRYEPSTGLFTALAPLPEPLQGAAAVTFANRPLSIGGGDAKPTANVGAFVDGKVSIVGRLPEARTEAQAVVLDKTLYIVGGYDGAKEPLTMLASADGTTFRQIGVLIQGNRRGTLVGVGAFLYLIGGEENGVASARILRIDPTDGAVTQIGLLPAPLSGAVGFVLQGSVFVAGGRHGNEVTDQILHIDLITGAATPAGLLPEPASSSSVAVLGDTAFVFGGEAAVAKAGVVAIRAAR